MAPTLDSSSEHAAHVWRKQVFLDEEKNGGDVYDNIRLKQITLLFTLFWTSTFYVSTMGKPKVTHHNNAFLASII